MLTLKRLKEVLDYDPTTGLFTRKIFRRVNWESRKLSDSPPKSYKQLTIDGIKYQAHRLAWFYHYGIWPTAMIDHIDRNKSNNAISNLRLAVGSINQINTKLHKHNTSGIRGVSWSKTNRKWTASVYRNGKRINLGYFDTKEAAHEARLLSEDKVYGLRSPN